MCKLDGFFFLRALSQIYFNSVSVFYFEIWTSQQKQYLRNLSPPSYADNIPQRLTIIVNPTLTDDTCSNDVSPLLLLALAVGGDWQAADLHTSLCGVCAAQRRWAARRLRQLPRLRAAAAHRSPGDGSRDPLRLPCPPVLPRLPQQVSDTGAQWRSGGFGAQENVVFDPHI